jgi:hypothetical protein
MSPRQKIVYRDVRRMTSAFLLLHNGLRGAGGGNGSVGSYLRDRESYPIGYWALKVAGKKNR